MTTIRDGKPVDAPIPQTADEPAPVPNKPSPAATKAERVIGLEAELRRDRVDDATGRPTADTANEAPSDRSASKDARVPAAVLARFEALARAADDLPKGAPLGKRADFDFEPLAQGGTAPTFDPASAMAILLESAAVDSGEKELPENERADLASVTHMVQADLARGPKLLAKLSDKQRGSLAKITSAMDAVLKSQPNEAAQKQGAVALPSPTFVKLENTMQSTLPDFAGMDVEALAQIVMFECGKDATDSLNDAIKEMHANSVKKKRARDYQTSLKAQRANVQKELREEYDERCGSPADSPTHIDGKTVSFDDYCMRRNIIGNVASPGDEDPATPAFSLTPDFPIFDAPPPPPNLNTPPGSNTPTGAVDPLAHLESLVDPMNSPGLLTVGKAGEINTQATLWGVDQDTAYTFYQSYAKASAIKDGPYALPKDTDFATFLTNKPPAGLGFDPSMKSGAPFKALTDANADYLSLLANAANEQKSVEQKTDPSTGAPLDPNVVADIQAMATRYGITEASAYRLYQVYCEATKHVTEDSLKPAADFDTFLQDPKPKGLALVYSPQDKVGDIQSKVTAYIKGVRDVENVGLDPAQAKTLVDQVLVLETVANQARSKPSTDTKGIKNEGIVPAEITNALKDARDKLTAFMAANTQSATQKTMMADIFDIETKKVAKAVQDSLADIASTKLEGGSDEGRVGDDTSYIAVQGRSKGILRDVQDSKDNDVHYAEMLWSPDTPFGSMFYDAMQAAPGTSKMDEQALKNAMMGGRDGWGNLGLHAGYRFQSSGAHGSIGQNSFFNGEYSTDLGEGSDPRNWGTWDDQKARLSDISDAIREEFTTGVSDGNKDVLLDSNALPQTANALLLSALGLPADSKTSTADLVAQANKAFGVSPGSDEHNLPIDPLVTPDYTLYGSGAQSFKGKSAWSIQIESTDGEKAGTAPVNVAMFTAAIAALGSAATQPPPPSRKLVEKIRFSQVAADGTENDSAASTTPQTMTLAGLDAAIEGWGNQVDSLGDIGEELQLRLQSANDQRAKIYQMMTNLLKQWSTTQEGIIANMK